MSNSEAHSEIRLEMRTLVGKLNASHDPKRQLSIHSQGCLEQVANGVAI